MEYVIDDEIRKYIGGNLLDQNWTPLIFQNKEATHKYFLNFIDFWHRLGYDFVRYEEGAGFYSSQRLGADTAELSRNKRYWVEEGKGMISNWEEFIQVDRKMHIALAKISDNPVYRFILEMVQQNIISYYKSFPLRSKEMMEENYQDLCDIVRKVEQGNAEEARLIIQRHIRKFNRYMKIESNRNELRAVDLKGKEL